MELTTELTNRSDLKCELCSNPESISAYTIAPKTGDTDDDNIVICQNCNDQISGKTEMDANHWRCLNDSMWNPTPAVQVMSYRLLKSLSDQDWALDAVNMMYMDEDTIEWAQSSTRAAVVHIDSNGNILQNGDTVVLIKDLDVKGTSLIAKRGVSVRRIRLVHDNAEQIEGKVEGQQIVILTKFVKKS